MRLTFTVIVTVSIALSLLITSTVALADIAEDVSRHRTGLVQEMEDGLAQGSSASMLLQQIANHDATQLPQAYKALQALSASKQPLSEKLTKRLDEYRVWNQQRVSWLFYQFSDYGYELIMTLHERFGHHKDELLVAYADGVARRWPWSAKKTLSAFGVVAGIAGIVTYARGGNSISKDKEENPFSGFTPLPPPATPEGDNQPGLQAINASVAHARGWTGLGIKVGLFDTGVVQNHPDLSPNIVAGYDGIDNDGDPSPSSSIDMHGTHVAGIIAATKNGVGMQGVAYNASIAPYRLLGIDETGVPIASSAEGYKQMVSHAIANNVQVINNSWGSYLVQPNIEINAIRDAIDADIIFVWGAGNDENDQPSNNAFLPQLFPEFREHWLAVVAVDENNEVATFSNRCGVTKAYCLAAPGVDILSTVEGGYFRLSGSSMAAPHVTGAVAVLLQAFPNKTPEAIVDILLETATDLGESGVDDVYGHGLLNLAQATQPIGGLAFTKQQKIGSGEWRLSHSVLSLSAPFGDALRKSSASLALVDERQRAYFMDLKNIVGNVNDQPMADIVTKWSKPNALWQTVSEGVEARFNDRDRQTYTSLGLRSQHFAAAYQYDASALILPSEVLTLRHESQAGASLLTPFSALQRSNFTVAARLSTQHYLAWENSRNAQSQTLFVNNDWAVGDDTTLHTRTGLLMETQGVLGSRTEGAFSLGSVHTYYAGAILQAQLNKKTYFLASYHTAYTPTIEARTLVQSISTLRSSTGGFALWQESSQNRYGIAAYQPLRVNKGELQTQSSTGYLDGKKLGYQTTAFSLRPSGHQRNVELFFSGVLSRTGHIKTSLQYSFDAGHQKGKEDIQLLLAWRNEF